MIGLLAGMMVHPHVVGNGGIRVRLGAGVDLTVPWDDVESVTKRYRSLPISASVRIEQDGDRRLLHVAVGKQTSIDVRLRRPMTFTVPNGPTGPVDEVRLYAVDTDGFRRSRTVRSPA
jgi:hypothetical protein